jgi:3-hydroxyacyl-[acyl-carrier-protein] dehydratase
MNAMRKQIQSLLKVQACPDGFRALLNVDPKLTVFPDHFRGYPLMPGICLMQAVVVASAISQGLEDLHVRALKNAKMMQPVLPGDQITIDAQITPDANGDFLIKAKLSSGEKRYAEFSIIAGPTQAAKEASP